MIAQTFVEGVDGGAIDRVDRPALNVSLRSRRFPSDSWSDADALFEFEIERCLLTKTTGNGDPNPQNVVWQLPESASRTSERTVLNGRGLSDARFLHCRVGAQSARLIIRGVGDEPLLPRG
ncbi:MAG: hypothetical protein QOG50_1538 [Actinomycetota bacterium]|nr:hypothetical protein [Actinomycetota bacterium]